MFTVALSKEDRNLTVKVLIAFVKFGQNINLFLALAASVLAESLAGSLSDVEEFAKEEADLIIRAIEDIGPALVGEFDEDVAKLNAIATRLKAAGESRPVAVLPPARGALMS